MTVTAMPKMAAVFSSTLLSMMPVVLGFADHLVMSNSACLTELDPMEVIMNNMVKPAKESDFPDMHLAVVAVDGSTVDSSKSVHDETANAYEFEYPASAQTVAIKFINPYSVAEYTKARGLQFVVDIINEPAEVASFQRGAGVVGCDGHRRVASKLKDDESLTVKINKPGENVRLLAGWAADHETVRLTPELILKPAAAAANPKPEEINSPAPPDPKEKREFDREHPNADSPKLGYHSKTRDFAYDHKEKVKGGTAGSAKHSLLGKEGKREKLTDDHKKAMKKITGALTDAHKDAIRQMTGRMAGLHKRVASSLGMDPNASPETDATRKKELLAKFSKQDEDRRASLKAELQRNFVRTFREKYESEDFIHRFHMTGYYYGCAFLIVSFGLFMLLTNGRREKGRRDL